jgi:hypothetical protein
MAETLNLGQHIQIIRQIINRDFYTTIDKEQALIRFAEFEMWMRHAKPKPEAAGRHVLSVEPGEYHDEDTLHKVYGAMVRNGVNGDEAQEIINSMQNAGLLFREIRADGSNHKRRVR